MIVDWGGALKIKDKKRIQVPRESMLWTDICKPTKSNQIYGNREPKDTIRNWFIKKQLGDKTENCLFVSGPSGTGKSSFIQLCAEEHGFDPVVSYADKARTAQKMDAVFCEVDIRGGMLILDDFEAFLKETSSIKALLKMLKDKSCEISVVVICNSTDNAFQNLKDYSVYAEFKPLESNDMYRIVSRLSSRVSDFCYIPPLASYFIAHSSTGNALQTISQLQYLYIGTKQPPKKRKRKTKGLQPIDTVSKRDETNKMIVSTFRNSSVEKFIDDKDVLNTMIDLNRDFLEDLGRNLHRDYPKYFHNGSQETLSEMSSCIDCLSSGDIMRPEQHEDRLYDTENVKLWADDSKNYVVGVCRGIKKLVGRRINTTMPSRKNKKRMVFVDYNYSKFVMFKIHNSPLSPKYQNDGVLSS